jgi:hypothetical protein
LLPVAGLVPQLPHDLAYLPDPGGPDRVAHGDQPAGRAHGATAANVERTFLE